MTAPEPTVLIFDAAAVAAQARHALTTTSHRALYGQTDPQSAVWLAHDQGVYLMSNGAGGDRPRPAYASGCDPDTDPDFWDTSRYLVGGDDFAELVADAELLAELAALTDGDTVTITVTDDTITLETITLGTPPGGPT